MLEQRPERPRPSILAASGLYLLAALGLLAVVFVWPQMSAGLQNAYRACFKEEISREGLNLIRNLFFYCLFIFLPIVLWMRFQKDAGDMLRLNSIPVGTMLKMIVLGAMSVVALYFLTLLWSAVLQKLGLNVFSSDVRPANAAEWEWRLFSLVLIAPVCEELLLRGVLLSGWETFGQKKAVMITAVWFAMLHGSIVGLPTEIAAGVLLGWIAIATDSVYAAMIWHGAYNAVAALLSFLTPNTSMSDGAVDLWARIGGGGGAVILLIGTSAMLAMLLRLVKRGIPMPESALKYAQPKERHVTLGEAEWLTIALGAVTMLYFYAADWLSRIGGAG